MRAIALLWVPGASYPLEDACMLFIPLCIGHVCDLTPTHYWVALSIRMLKRAILREIVRSATDPVITYTHQ